MAVTDHETETIGTRDLTHWHSVPGQLLSRWARSKTPWVAASWVLTLGAIVAALATAGAEGVWDSVHESNGIAGVDQPMLDQMIRWRSPGLNSAVTVFTHLGGPIGMPIIVVLLAASLALVMRRWGPVLLIGLGAAGSLGLTLIGKYVVGRHRPPLAEAVPPFETSPSFPSGHTLNATVVFTLTAYFMLTILRTKGARTIVVLVATLLTLAMGMSRVYLGHHWFSDVVMGWAVGVLWSAIVITVHRIWLTSRREHPEAAGLPGSPRPDLSRTVTTEAATEPDPAP